MAKQTWILVAALAGRQHGVISIRQLYKCGMSRAAVHRAVRAGHLHRLHQGVYAVGHLAMDAESHWHAATIACGPLAFLSHGPSAELQKLLRQRGRLVEVTVPSQNGRSRRGIRVHRVATLRRDETGSVDGIPCTSPARTIVDLAASGSRRELEWAIKEGEGKLFSPAEVDRILARHGRCPGAPLLIELLSLRDPVAGMTRSELEVLFFDLCRRYGMPLPDVNITIVANCRKYEVDFTWPSLHLVVETDGRRWHSGRFATDLDERRDRDLTIAGWRIQRLTWRQIVLDPEGAGAIVFALIDQQRATA